MKQNQTFFHEAYSNLTPYLSLSKNIRTFHWLLKSKYLSFTIKVDRNNRNETKSDISMGHIQIWHHVFFYQKLLKSFNDFQNQNLSLLWLKWNQTMEIKQNQTFFHGTYSNLTPYLSLPKNIVVFQWLLKSKFLSFKTKVNRKNRNGTTWDIFHGTYSSLTPYLSLSKIIKTF